jgi:hypothetical protein
MEFAVYRVFQDEDGRRMGSFVNMLASREEAEAYARGRDGEHEVVGLWTREISEEDGDLWDTVVFNEDGDVEPVGGSE